MATVHHLHEPSEGYRYHFLRGQPWRDDLGHQIEVDELDHPDEYAPAETGDTDLAVTSALVAAGLFLALATFAGWIVVGPLAAGLVAITGAPLAHLFLRQQRRPLPER